MQCLLKIAREAKVAGLAVSIPWIELGKQTQRQTLESRWVVQVLWNGASESFSFWTLYKWVHLNEIEPILLKLRDIIDLWTHAAIELVVYFPSCDWLFRLTTTQLHISLKSVSKNWISTWFQGRGQVQSQIHSFHWRQFEVWDYTC